MTINLLHPTELLIQPAQKIILTPKLTGIVYIVYTYNYIFHFTHKYMLLKCIRSSSKGRASRDTEDLLGPDRSPTPLIRLWVCGANESLSLRNEDESTLPHLFSLEQRAEFNTDSEGLGSLRSHTPRLWHTPTLALSHIQSVVTPLLCPGYVGR